MRVSVRCPTLPRVAAIVASVWLCVTGPAWAGAGGEDVGGIQAVLNLLCQNLGTSCAIPLPPLPTITQQVLEIAGLSNTPPDKTRSQLSICDFNNGPACKDLVVNAVNLPAKAPVLTKLAPAASCGPNAGSSQICPLAFISARTGKGQAIATQPSNRSADTFIYAVTTIGTSGPTAGQPDTLTLVYDYLPRTLPFFIKNRVLGRIALPLVELLSDLTSERIATANLEIAANCNGGPDCLGATAVGDFIGSGTPQRLSPADLGVTFRAVFGASPNSKVPHAIFEVDIPLLVNSSNDPPYYFSPGAVFSATNPGFAFGPSTSVGAAPDAARFAASFSPSVAEDEGDQLPFLLRPAVKADLAIGINGAALASAPLPAPP